MNGIRDYLLSIITAALVCSIVNLLIPKDSGHKGLIRMICGIFIAITTVSPIAKFKINDIQSYWSDIQTESDNIIDQGESVANTAYRDIIKERCEAYILDKASVMGLTIEVEVTLSDTIPSSPYSVKIAGAISPYSKKRLKEIIVNDLAIPEERQKWT